MIAPKLSLPQRFYRWANNTIMTRLVPLDRPGPFLAWLFRLGGQTYNQFFARIAADRILLLTTTGRKTGLTRKTALEYSRDPKTGGYIIMAGWKGRSDWVRNLRANPCVQVQVGFHVFQCVAQRLTDEEVAENLRQALPLNPGMLDIFARWVGHPLDGSPESLLEAARTIPSFLLVS